MVAPIVVHEVPLWIDKKTRPAVKYSPVKVDKTQGEEAQSAMVRALRNRVVACYDLQVSTQKPQAKDSTAFEFKYSAVPNRFRSLNPPVIVISGGSSDRIHEALRDSSNGRLIWHPKINKGRVIYLLVHRNEYRTYKLRLKNELDVYPNMIVVGWSRNMMAGFGTTREAAVAFADQLVPCPPQILVADQDVVETTAVNFQDQAVIKQVLSKHAESHKVVGLGYGVPEREKVDKYGNIILPQKNDIDARVYVSPTQQLVSIQGPFRPKGQPGIYPGYMVAGGEDMLMSYMEDQYSGKEVGADKENAALLRNPIIKKDLGPISDREASKVEAQHQLRAGMVKELRELERFKNSEPPSIAPSKSVDIKKAVEWAKSTPYDQPNLSDPVKNKVLATLYSSEKSIPLAYSNEKKVYTIESLLEYFVSQNWIDGTPNIIHNTSACIVERIILRLYSSFRDKWPKELVDCTLLDQYRSKHRLTRVWGG